MEPNGTISMLSEAGFTRSEIVRLYKVRKAYIARKKVEAQAEQRRLEFMRWLVSTGRLNEQAA